MGNFITTERLFMEIRQGYSYHIKDEFFNLVQDKYLMSNKEQGNYRPHYYAIPFRYSTKISLDNAKE